MSQAQAQAVAEQISQAMAQALGVAVPSSVPATSGARPSLSTAVRDLRPDSVAWMHLKPDWRNLQYSHLPDGLPLHRL